MTTTDDELTALVLGEGGPNYPGYERRKQIIDALRSELAERTRERDEAEKREHANRVSCEQNFAMLTDEREAHKLAHSQWCAERDAHAETKAGATAPPATTGEPSAMEFAERLRSYVRSGWHNHAIVRELDAFAARAVSAERERLREMVANVPHDIWDIIDNDGDPVSAPIDALAVLVADLRAGKEEGGA